MAEAKVAKYAKATDTDDNDNDNNVHLLKCPLLAKPFQAAVQ